MSGTFRIEPGFIHQAYDRYRLALTETPNDSSYQAIYQECLGLTPSLEELEAMIECSFWASCEKQEGRTHTFSLAFSPPDKDGEPFLFSPLLPFDSAGLARLAPALAPDVVIGVWRYSRESLRMWGFSPTPIWGAVSVRAFEPNHLLVSLPSPSMRLNLLVTGSRGAVIEENSLLFTEILFDAAGIYSMPHGVERQQAMLNAMMGAGSGLPEIARLMRSHGHGGTLLVVREEGSCSDSLHHPFVSAGAPYDRLKRDVTDRRNAVVEGEYSLFRYSEKKSLVEHRLRRSLAIVANLTAVDGATLVTRDLAVLAFGVKIKPRDADHKPDRVLVSEPFEGSPRSEVGLADLGGTRHQSAAQFVFDQRDALAIVASQDGRLSAFHWDPISQMVAVARHMEYALL